MLRVIEQAYCSDTGRQRTANEDSLFVRSPLFAVADGMGGAQAGEVASKIAAESFEPAQIDETIPPETFLREIVEGANRRIHELSQSDSTRSGMGTTLTAALLRGDELSLAHVGDSRAYLFRDGELRLLTSDHSLVEELRRQGRLTAAQAEEHPQRSIITRALGPEPEVNVDTMTYKSRAGDVYILCSDGLTTMVKEPAIESIAGQANSLDQLATELVRAANDAGGRDNITVVAFKVAEAGDESGADEATLVGPSAEAAGLTAEAVREGVSRQRATTTSGARSAPQRIREPQAPLKPKRSRKRRLVSTMIATLVLAAVIIAGVIGTRQVYFLGTDDSGRLSLYRGLPYDLPLGANLYSKQYSTPILAGSVPQKRRGSVTDHELRSHDDATSLLGDLRKAAEQVTAKGSSGQSGTTTGQGGKTSTGTSTTTSTTGTSTASTTTKNTPGKQSSGSGGKTTGGTGSNTGGGTGSGGGNGSSKP